MTTRINKIFLCDKTDDGNKSIVYFFPSGKFCSTHIFLAPRLLLMVQEEHAILCPSHELPLRFNSRLPSDFQLLLTELLEGRRSSKPHLST